MAFDGERTVSARGLFDGQNSDGRTEVAGSPAQNVWFLDVTLRDVPLVVDGIA